MTPAANHALVVESFGVPIRVVTNSAVAFARLHEALPPGSNHLAPTAVDYEIGIFKAAAGTWELHQGERRPTGGVTLNEALDELQRQLRRHVAFNAPRAVFVHAGVVADGRRTIILPGTPFAGKSTLVASLVRAGAIYFSDEYAVFDDHGLVHPFAKPLSLRDVAGVQRHRSVESLGGVAGNTPLSVGAVIFTEYRAGASWSPEPLSAGQALLAITDHTVPLRERPGPTLRALAQALRGAIALRSHRGEATETAEALLDLVRLQRAD